MILWVDDQPANNTYERQALEALGINVVFSTSTEDALLRMRSSRFDVVVSDMGRPPDPLAGYTLLEQLRSAGDKTPFVIYSTSDRPEHKALARKRGAFGSTSNPQELLQLVVAGIVEAPPS
jgi:CheY-like chemotaxis protein